MSDNSVDVMDIVPLSKDDSDVHMFKVSVAAYSFLWRPFSDMDRKEWV